MGAKFWLFFATFFAATTYAAVVLIQLGGWLPILAGLLLFCNYFAFGSLVLLGAGVAIDRKKNIKKEELK